MFRLVDKEWGLELERALYRDRSELRIVCPFIKTRALDRLLAMDPQRVRVVTRYNLDDFARCVSDIAALRKLLDRGASVRGIRNLHAKLYLFGESRAVVTSANLTDAGLDSNPEFGIVVEDPTAIARCLAYFNALWECGGEDLCREQVEEWHGTVTDYLASGAHPAKPPGFGDFGADAGLAGMPRISSLSPFSGQGQAFVKFLGRRGDRARRSQTAIEEVRSAGCHWALAYPRGRRPRIVEEGALMYIARLTDEPDIRVFGRAVGLQHVPGRDDATSPDIGCRPWKESWPHYIRVHHAEFLSGSMADGVSLYALMDALGSDSFGATQQNAAQGEGNTNPRRAYMRQPAVRLTPEGSAWLDERLRAAFEMRGKIPADELNRLDWPSISRASSAPILSSE